MEEVRLKSPQERKAMIAETFFFFFPVLIINYTESFNHEGWRAKTLLTIE
jgi:hypothetical protein